MLNRVRVQRSQRGLSQAELRLMQEDRLELEALLAPAEVAAMFRVDAKTVTRWAKDGKLKFMRSSV